MTDTGRNHGISQSGDGQINNSGAMAVGTGARASQQVPAAEQARKDLRELRTLLAAHGAELPEAARIEAEEKAAEVAGQLDGPGPRDRGRLAAAVAVLTYLVRSVAPLAESAESLGRTVEKLVH